MASLSQTPITRHAAAMILCETSNHAAEMDLLTKIFVQEYCDLCQDPDLAIRLAMFDNLPVLLPKVRHESERVILTTEIVACLKDIHADVRARVISLTVTMNKLFDVDKLRLELVPELGKELLKSESNPSFLWLRSHLSEVIELFIKRSLVCKELTNAIQQFFKSLWNTADIDSLKLAVQAMTSMAHLDFSSSSTESSFESILQEKLKSEIINAEFAKVFPDVLTIYHEYYKEERMKPYFVSLFWNPNISYAKGLFPNLSLILAQLSQAKKEDEDNVEEPVLAPSAAQHSVEEKKTVNKPNDAEFFAKTLRRIRELWSMSKSWPWKDQESFIKAIPELKSTFKLEDYSNYFLDELFVTVRNGNRQTKAAAIRCICDLVSHNYYAKKRTETFTKLMDLGKSSSNYYDRHHFLVFCETALEYFSFKLLQELKLFDQFFKLTDDKVSNIRLKAISVSVPIWKCVDEPLREEIQEKLNTLRNDKNKEVRNFADTMFTQIQSKGAEFRKHDPLTAEHNKLRAELERNLLVKEQEEWKRRKEEELSLKAPKKLKR